MSSIWSVVTATVQSYPDRVALRSQSESVTYHQLEQLVCRACDGFRSRNLTNQDIVVLAFGNTVQCIIAFLALAQVGVSVVPVEPTISAYEFDTISSSIPITALVIDPAASRHIRAGHTYGCDIITVPDMGAGAAHHSTKRSKGVDSEHRSFLYHFTSGSTGKPKAALHPQTNLTEGGLMYKHQFSLTPNDRIMVPIPLSHSFGMIGGLLATLVSGACLLLPGRFQPRRLVSLAASQGATVLLGSPLMYDLIVSTAAPCVLDADALRVCLSSGSQLPSATAEAFESRYGRRVYQIYGSTETGLIAAQWPRSEPWPSGTLGLPARNVEIRIRAGDGAGAPPDAPGDLLVKTATMCLGYYNDAGATANAFQDDWYVTGDLAYRDRFGHLFLQGRKETFINVGGKKVNPTEVETVLVSHPRVREALVYGVDIGAGGQAVEAAVALDGEVTDVDLAGYCRERLAAHKVPTQFRVVPAIPRTGLGKTRRDATLLPS